MTTVNTVNSFNFAVFLFSLVSLIPQNRENKNSEKVFNTALISVNYAENIEFKDSMKYQKYKNVKINVLENKCFHSIE